MRIDIAAPASLVLGLVRFDDPAIPGPCLLGVTLQHPPVNLAAVRSSGLKVSGPRAEAGLAYLQQVQAAWGISGGLEVDIDLAIPTQLGLGSDAVLGLSLARALAWASDRPPEDTPALARALDLGPGHGLETWGFDRGGLLLVDAQAGPDGPPVLRRRAEIAHPDKEAWAFHLVLHRPPDDSPETLEADRLASLLAASEHLSPETGRLVDEKLWPAVEADDIEAFGAAVMSLQRLNDEALAKAGVTRPVTDQMQQLVEAMKEEGALAWGVMATGLGQFAMIRGRVATQALRLKLIHTIGLEGGTAIATIADNQGARHTLKDQGLDPGEFDMRVNVGPGQGEG
jgi:predicted sugar kinase